MSGVVRGDLKADVKTFTHQVKPLLHKYCVGCHGSKKTKGKIRFDNIDPDIIAGKHTGIWEDAREAFNTGEMPPKEEKQPTAAERDVITHWLDAEFKKAKQFGNPNKKGRVRRLTRYELRYALEDLLRISVADKVKALPEEGTSPETGLKNSAHLLVISSPHLESYLDVILLVIDSMKEAAALKPYRERFDIKGFADRPAAKQGRKKRGGPSGKIERSGKGLAIGPQRSIDLKIPGISRGMFRTTLMAKAEGPGHVEVSIGFQYSDVDKRTKIHKLGLIKLGASPSVKQYVLNSRPEDLPAEMARALDRPFFVRITNRGKQPFYFEGFHYEGNINPEWMSTLLPAEIAPSGIDKHVQVSIAAFLEKAFRRSPTKAELEKYNGIYRQYRRTEKPVHALLDTYKEILCSPRFLYIGLPGDLSPEANENYKLAERMAFFLWCSVPDDRLLKAASDGQLAKPSVLASHVERMLKDGRSKRWVERFADQWLQTSKLFNVAVDDKYYPRFKESLKGLMRQETIESVNDVFRNGSPALNLLKADHVFVNQPLAAFYQVKGVKGEAFQKVSVGEKGNRGGLLTQGTFMIGNSDGMNSHAILRGVWLTDVILNDPPPDPPNNVPPLDESIPGFDKMTLNQKLKAHRNHAACRNCHRKIDPWGIPFENYDASGAWREKVLVISQVPGEPKGKKKRKKPVFEKSHVAIEAGATLPDGVAIEGIEELKEYLVTHRKHDFAKGLTERILAYALSRDIDFHDEDFVKQLSRSFEKNNHSVPRLINEIVQSERFGKGY